MKQRIGKCSKCGKGAAWNTPGLTEDGKLMCNTCTDKPDAPLTRGIEQYTDEDGKYVANRHASFSKGGVILWTKEMCAWTDGGRRGWPLSDAEKQVANTSPVYLIDAIIVKRMAGITKCTQCEKEIEEKDVAGRPLFCGVACKPCWAKHLEHLEEQKRKGQVCRMCRKPWGACCC